MAFRRSGVRASLAPPSFHKGNGSPARLDHRLFSGHGSIAARFFWYIASRITSPDDCLLVRVCPLFRPIMRAILTLVLGFTGALTIFAGPVGRADLAALKTPIYTVEGDAFVRQ